jgi:hypothetical protein
VTTHGTPEVFPELDLDLLVGLTVPEATAIAQAAGVEMIRPIERMNGQMVGAIDMMRAPRRLNLWHQDGQVILANFDGGRRSSEPRPG